MFNRKNDESDVWISMTDLMSGLLVVFIFIAVVMTDTFSSANAQKGIKVVKSYQQAIRDINKNINKQFNKKERLAYNIQDDGSATFINSKDKTSTINDNTVIMFNQGSALLTPEGKKTLKPFLIKYVKAIARCNPNHIKELRVEGHTSTEWGNINQQIDTGLTKKDADYLKNMELSQARARAIVNYALSLPELKDYKDFIKTKMTANGLSSSHIIKHNGQEDAVLSRRVEFRVETDNTSLLKENGGTNDD